MSHTITLTVSDEVYTALQRQAEAAGTSPDRLAATSLERQFGHGDTKLDADRSSDTAAHRQMVEGRFARHFGTVDLGHPTGADNESIDIDLAREYAGRHESG